MNFDMGRFDALNSATKYPSIETYHVLGERGRLTEKIGPFADVTEGMIIFTEKIDGTNGRIVLLPDGDYFIGSREELWYAKGDRVENPKLGIVNTLKPLAEKLSNKEFVVGITTLYLEVYGGGREMPAAREYTSNGSFGYRLFDVSYSSSEVLSWEAQRIASWRENGGQQWLDEDGLQTISYDRGISLTPRVGTMRAENLPKSVEGMHQCLKNCLPRTWVALDENSGGRSEGIVLRTENRSRIAKARFQNYERTLDIQSLQPRKRRGEK